MMTQVTGNVLKVLRKKLLRYHGLQMLIGEFYQSLREGSPPPVTIQEARPIIQWTERIAQQADQAKQKCVTRFATRRRRGRRLSRAHGVHWQAFAYAIAGRAQQGPHPRPARSGRRPDGRPARRSFLGNLGNRDDVERAVEGTSEVFHLGATIEGWAEDFQCATTLGTRHIVDSVLCYGVPKLIYMDARSA